MATPKHIASLFFSYLGLVFWSIQLVPQVILNYRRKSTGDLSLLMLILWVLWSPFFFGYGLYKDLTIPFLLQPYFFGFFGNICLAQVIYYRDPEGRRSKTKASIVFAITMFLLGALSVACYYITKGASDSPHKGAHWIGTLMGVIPTILIPIGFAPQFWQVYVEKGCRGVSLVFILGDMCGSLFSLIGLLLQETIDHLSLGTFIATLICDILLFICVVVTRMLDSRKLRREAITTEDTEYTGDDIIAEDDDSKIKKAPMDHHDTDKSLFSDTDNQQGETLDSKHNPLVDPNAIKAGTGSRDDGKSITSKSDKNMQTQTSDITVGNDEIDAKDNSSIGSLKANEDNVEITSLPQQQQPQIVIDEIPMDEKNELSISNSSESEPKRKLSINSQDLHKDHHHSSIVEAIIEDVSHIVNDDNAKVCSRRTSISHSINSRKSHRDE